MHSGTPVKFFVDPHGGGVADIDISPDALYIATLGVKSDEDAQTLALWEWTVGRQKPLYEKKCPVKEPQTCVRFNENDIREIATNGKKSVVFWNWSSKELIPTCPLARDSAFLRGTGTFTQTIFKPDSTQAITATTSGDIVIWDVSQDEEFDETVRRASKVVNLNNGNGINVIGLQSGLIWTGGNDGFVKFYDLQLRIVAWFEDLKGGPVTSVSFCVNSASEGNFVIPNFTVGTTKALVISVDASSFDALEPESRRGIVLVQGFEDRIVGIASHPSKAVFVAASETGTIQAWDHEEKRLLMVRSLPRACSSHVHCL